MNSRSKAIFGSTAAPLLNQKKMSNPVSTNQLAIHTFLKNRQRAKHVNKSFSPPVWMKKLNQPSKEFDLSPPSYREIASIIRRMKSSGSPCPFDQIRVIVLKRCPIIRTMIWKIIEKSWEIGKVPTVWKKGLTVLIRGQYRSGKLSSNNFRARSLQSIYIMDEK